MIKEIFGSIFVAALAVFAYFAVHFYRLPKSRFFTAGDILMVYIVRIIVNNIAKLKWRTFEKNARNYYAAQEQFVLRQIRDNEDSGYGRDHQFQRIHSLADFRRLHPVTDYYHYSDYIARAEKGDTKAILGKDQIEIFACSSGTTGKAKHIPISKQFKKLIMELIGVMIGFHGEQMQSRTPLFKEMQVMCVPRWRKAECGIPIGPLSGMFMGSRLMMAQWSTPYEAVVVDTEAEALYVSLLFGLRDRDLINIEGSFAAGFFNTLRFMEDNWRDLVADIQSGRLKEGLNISDEKRNIINGLLVPDAERARELEVEFKKGMDGILKRIFPNLVSIGCLSSGTSMALYKKRCKPYVKGVVMQSLFYGSSESFMGMNMRSSEHEPAYVLVPSAAFVEFLPVDEAGSAIEGQQPVLSHQVQIGKLYEMVITNCSGFYRYRMGDIVKVVDFYHQAPAVDFQFRAGQLLNVHMEKLSEESFYNALQAAVEQWPGVVLRDFTSAESVLDPSPRPGAPYYLVFLELEAGKATPEQLDMIDATLCEQNYVYKSFRVKDSIAPMRVLLVKPGTFAVFRQFVFDTTTAYMGQFKQARVLRTREQVDVFMKHLA